MKKAMLGLLAAALCGAAVAETSFTVKNVEAHQRYPWNGKVDIDFLIDCTDSSADFKVTVECTDHVGNTNIVMKTLSYKNTSTVETTFTLKAGQHRLTWDADADMPNMKLPHVSFAVFVNILGETDTKEFLVIDLSGGADAMAYPVWAMIGVPSGGWTDEYKTTKLVLRRCSAGADPLGRYTLTKDFYAGVFEVTQKQWYLVMGESRSSSIYGEGDIYPVYGVSYDMIRGASTGANWPSSSAVDPTSFIGKLRAKTGLAELDLPTEAQWEYACRAGTTTTYSYGNSSDGKYMWFADNNGSTSSGTYGAKAVGTTKPNPWGFYDMHGNVREWCLDWYGVSLIGSDPVGAPWNTSSRVMRGGYWAEAGDLMTSSWCDLAVPSNESIVNGFRLFRTVP